MKNTTFAILIILGLFTSLLADTNVPSGEVSGNWTLTNSPYILQGSVIVPQDSILIIDPGVNVIFTTFHDFKINGKLLAEGTMSDTILFTTQDSLLANLMFEDISLNQQDSSFVIYAKFDQVGINFENSSGVELNSCSIINGDAIGLNNSSPLLNNLTIMNNFTDDYGGGIDCNNSSSPTISNSIIYNNTADMGGGISCRSNSNAIFSNVIIMSNHARGAGGISCYESSLEIIFVEIINNTSSHSGAGIECVDESNLIIDNSFINGNTCNGFNSNGGGIFGGSLSTITITNSQINNNVTQISGGGICFMNGSQLTIINTEILNNSAGISDDSMGLGGGFNIEGNVNVPEVYLINTKISGNTAWDAGGIHAWDDVRLNLTNCTVTNNTITNEFTPGCVGGVGCEYYCEIYITNSIIWGNEGSELYIFGPGNSWDLSYSNIAEWEWEGVGILNTDPLFADDEYHLTEDSPCIDSGNPGTLYKDIEDPNNPGTALYPAMGSMICDMGYYGGNGYYTDFVSSEPDEILAVSDLQLSNYPNPFNPSTTISFELNTEITENTEIEIYNVKGQKIKTILCHPEPVEGRQAQTTYTTIWHGTDQSGNPVASGVYFYKLNVEDSPIKKMVLLK